MESDLTLEVERLAKEGDQFKWVPETVHLNPKDWEIVESDVDGELCKQGHTLGILGDLVAELKVEVSRKEAAIERHDALTYRDAKAENPKATEASLKQLVLADDTHHELLRSLYKSKFNHAKASNRFKSLEHRASCLIALAYKMRSELKYNAI